MRLVGQIDVHVRLGFLGFSFSFLGTCLLTFPMTAFRAMHTCRHMPAPSRSAHMGVCTEGLAGEGPRLGTLGLFNTLLFSPLQPPKPSDLSIVCFTSGTTGKQRLLAHQPGPPAPFPGSFGRVTETSPAPSVGWAEPCPVPGSRLWVLPAAPSGQREAAWGGWT